MASLPKSVWVSLSDLAETLESCSRLRSALALGQRAIVTYNPAESLVEALIEAEKQLEKQVQVWVAGLASTTEK